MKKNKVLALIMSLALVMSFAGCGDDKKTTGPDSQAAQNEVKKTAENENSVGDIITFGSYEQDNDTSNGKEEIEWVVLDTDGDKTLVISRYALDAKPYNNAKADVTWETCTLREWLNEEFLKKAFSSEEQEQIISSELTNPDNGDYGTNGGNDTVDKVFLLSIDDVEEYFSSEDEMTVKPTEYAKSQGAAVNKENGNTWWLLRTPGSHAQGVADVSISGSILAYGRDVNSVYDGIRPAMWITL